MRCLSKEFVAFDLLGYVDSDGDGLTDVIDDDDDNDGLLDTGLYYSNISKIVNFLLFFLKRTMMMMGMVLQIRMKILMGMV